MSTIFIETIPIGNGEFEFTQTWTSAGVNLHERVWIETHEDRMYAAMTNLGKACKWLEDAKELRASICIVPDRDGRDKKFGGEHDELFEAVHSQADYEKNKIKYSIFYGKYVNFLDRIRHLANANEIAFTQGIETEVQSSKFKVQSFVESNPDDPSLIVNQNWNRDNLLKLSLKGDRNIITCRACQAELIVMQTANFMSSQVKHWETKRVMKITNPKQLIEHFLNTHLYLHGKLKIKKRKVKAATWR